MIDDKPPLELSAEELEFIRQLCVSTEEVLHTLAETATIDAPDMALNLLNLLLLADNIRLQAEVGNFTLIFEPKAESSPEAEQRQLHLGYPSIIEKSDNLRSHRISHRLDKINGDIRLSETSGRLKNIHLKNISETGMEVVCDTPGSGIVPGKTVLSFKIRFPDDRGLSCQGTVVRVNRRKKKPTLAFRFTRASRRMHDLLKAYIYHHSPEFAQAAPPDKPRGSAHS